MYLSIVLKKIISWVMLMTICVANFGSTTPVSSYAHFNEKPYSNTYLEAESFTSTNITYYDTAGRQVKTVNGDGAVLSETIYDTENRILQTVDAKGMVSENVYNSLGQIEKVNEGAKGTKNSDGTYSMSGDIHTESYEYDDLGRTNKVTDADNGVSSVVFDSLGRIVSLKDPNQNAADAEGRTWSVNNGNTYTYEYNDKGLLSGETNSLNNVTTYEYNAKMLLDTMTDSAGEDTKYEYDSLNRPWKIKDGLGTIEYEYDANGNVLEVSEKEGLLSQKKTITRTYDELNRVTSYTDYKGREVKYGYDELGNLQTLTYPGGEIVKYTYNPNGTVATMSSNSSGTFTYGYDNYGRLCRISRPDGSVEERTYDNAGQLTEQVDKDKAGNILQKNHYVYDVFGEITEKTTSTEGDLTKLVSVHMEYDSANRLTTYNGEEVIYDVKGNMTYGPVDGKMTELTYDCRNRLVKAGKVSYTYDCENTRIATEEDGITTEYVTDTGGSLSRLLIAYENIGTANTSETHYYYGAEGLAAQVSIEGESSNRDENTTTGGQYFAYHYDNIGSTTLVTDKTGRIVEEFAYGTYGELLTEVVNNIRFLYNGSYGVVTDSNGLYYMRARYYNPDIKRFINQDIKVGDISNGQGLNRYAYCEGNPVSMVDPFGLCGQSTLFNECFSLGVHFFLSVLGMIPGGGNLFDLADAAFSYYYDKDPVGAALSLACAIPLTGIVAGAGKFGKNAIKLSDKILDVIKGSRRVVNTTDMAADTVKVGREMKRLGIMDNLGRVFVKSEKIGDFLKNGGEGLKRVAGALKNKGDDLYTSVRKLAKGSDQYVSNIKKKNRGFAYWPFGKGGSKSIKPYEVTTYDDFRTRSVVGDGLEGHEMWQHSNMKNKGYATTRLSTEASRNNPVIALPHEVHVDVNRQQYLFDGKNQTPFENIINNANIMYNNNDIPNEQVTKQLIDALKHLDDIGGD